MVKSHASPKNTPPAPEFLANEATVIISSHSNTAFTASFIAFILLQPSSPCFLLSSRIFKCMPFEKKSSPPIKTKTLHSSFKYSIAYFSFIH